MEKSKTNKVRFGLKNAHWAKMTGIGEDGKPTYETPEKMPGAVSLSIDPDGENENFYADDGVYYVTPAILKWHSSPKNSVSKFCRRKKIKMVCCSKRPRRRQCRSH